MYFLCLFNSTVVVNLPLDVIGEILSHVPVKSLLRFRATCKSWRSLIDSPYFISLHLNRSIQSSSNTNVIFLSFCGVYQVDFNVVDKAYEADWSRTCDINCFLGCQNGLICIRDPRGDVLWNPSIRKVKVLPLLSSKPYDPRHANVSVAEASGFGYDSFADDYKLLRISQFYDSDNRTFNAQAMCYSSRIDAWKSLGNMPYDLPCYRNAVGVFLGGALHWVVLRKHGLGQPCLIAAFDLTFESFREVQLPETGNVGGYFEIQLAVLGGCLCMMATCGSSICDFWIMKEYGSKDSWCKLLSLPGGSVKPLAYSRDGDNVLLLQRERKLCWYNLKSKQVSEVKVSGLPDCSIDGVTCVGTLVPPTLLCGESDCNRQKLEPEDQFCLFDDSPLFAILFCLIILLFLQDGFLYQISKWLIL